MIQPYPDPAPILVGCERSAMNEAHELVQFHTAARRVPQLIGKIYGWRIWGGPYTLKQFVAFAVIVFVGWQGWDVWPVDNPFSKFALIVGAAVGAMFVLRIVPPAPMTLPHQITGVWAVIFAPAWGRLDGRVISPHRPRTVRYGPITVGHPHLPVRAMSMQRAAGQSPRDELDNIDAAPKPLTSVQQLLAADLELRAEGPPTP